MKSTSLILWLLALSSLMSCNSQKSSTSENMNSEYIATDYFGAYTLDDKFYGAKTVVTIEKGKRKIVSNGLPNHHIGKFPNDGNPNTISAQNASYEIPLRPFYTGKAKWVRQIGVALNGVKFEPGTAERYECESGEVYRVEAVQQLINLGLDFNNAHVQTTGAYHYHAKPVGIIKPLDKGNDLVHIGFAMDGFPMYYSKNGVYKPSYRLVTALRKGTDCSYDRDKTKQEDLEGTVANGMFVQDWEYVKGLGDLDKCNGTRINGSYAYVITDEYPYISRCLKGKFTEEKHNKPPPETDKSSEND